MQPSDIILGIDLGTSSVKAALLDARTGILGNASRDYTVDIPHPGRGEQNPETWWQSLLETLAELRRQYPGPFRAVSAVGLSGQMHGIVLVDADNRPLRPAILWMDSRASDIAKELETRLGRENVARILHNRIFPGFALPSLVWVKKHEPDIYKKIAWALSPKDYIRLRLTGEIGSECSDASATAMFDVGKGMWANDILEHCGIDAKILPRPAVSTDIAGTVRAQCADETGLSRNARVVYGAADQPAQSIGNGVCGEGQVIANIGTGGQVSCFSATDRYDPRLRVHTFRHALADSFTVFGAALASGMSLNWFANNIVGEKSFAQLTEEAAETEPGSDGLLFLPYLSGERSPHMNPDASAMFFGLRLEHDKRHLTRAVMEGVAYSLLDSLVILKDLGVRCDSIIASGGGAKSPLWLQIQADVFNHPVAVSEESEQACLGAAILAGNGTGIFPDIREAVSRLVHLGDVVYTPRAAHASRYREQYEIYRELYLANHKAMERLRKERRT